MKVVLSAEEIGRAVCQYVERQGYRLDSRGQYVLTSWRDDAGRDRIQASVDVLPAQAGVVSAPAVGVAPGRDPSKERV